jgi:glycerophosphoryl diester phosphodiesterase
MPNARSTALVTRACLAVALAGGLAVGGASGAGDDEPRSCSAGPRHAALSGLPTPLVTGHRGSAVLCAENTLPCYAQALRDGARALEGDLQVLGDGSLVMFHDADTMAVTGRRHALDELDLGRLQRLDAGWSFTRDDGRSFPLRGQGITAPRLTDFLGALPDVPILLDVKLESPAMPRALLRFARDELSASDRLRLYVKVSDDALARKLRELPTPPKVAFTADERGWLVLRLTLGLGPGGELDALPPGWIDLPWIAAVRYVLPELSCWAAARGHLLTISTVDDRETMAEILATGLVDGIVTNRPDLLSALLAERATPRPASAP